MKNLKKTIFMYSLMLVAGTMSCKKQPDDNSGGSLNTNQTGAATVYLLGVEYSGPSNNITSTVKCWKNGTVVNLGNPSGTGYGITLSGDDSYLACTMQNAGTTFGTFTSNAGYLKNDRLTNLSEPTSRAYGIAVSGSDVYVCGYDRYKGAAAYWKNGTITKLNTYSSSDQNMICARAIAVAGTDIYVAGYETNGTYTVAKYWRNGKAVNLSNGSNDAYASSIVVTGTDIYVAGYEKTGVTLVAKYWKNGNAVSLSNGNLNTIATGIAVSGTDVYVCGTESTNTTGTALYWKNGKSVNLGNGGTSAIAVLGSDIYVAGYIGNNAAMWKNGTAETISLSIGANSAQANAIAVVPK